MIKIDYLKFCSTSALRAFILPWHLKSVPGGLRHLRGMVGGSSAIRWLTLFHPRNGSVTLHSGTDLSETARLKNGPLVRSLIHSAALIHSLTRSTTLSFAPLVPLAPSLAPLTSSLTCGKVSPYERVTSVSDKFSQ